MGGEYHFPKEIKMTKITATILIILGLFLSACDTSQTSTGTSQAPVAASELTGSYECFAIEGANTSDLGTLILNADQTATFGSNTIQWNYDSAANLITFIGDGTMRDAIYFSEGQSLSINQDAEDHFTCIKSE
jgi:hypothetical protein